jgi:hypothetical protein
MRKPLVLPALVAVAALVAAAAPAVAAPPTQRTIKDPLESGKAYDILAVTLKAAVSTGRKAQVVVDHDRRVRVGDGIDLWIDTDDDRQPDLYLTGYAFSEYAVYKAHGWTGHGRDISDRGCASLRMRGMKTIVRVDPSCLAPSTRFAVSVRSFVQDRPDASADHVPGRERLSKKVLSYQPASSNQPQL